MATILKWTFVRTLKSLAWLVRDKRPVLIPLDDDLLLQLSTVPAVEAVLARSDRNTFVNMVTTTAPLPADVATPPLSVLVERLGGNLKRCLCHDEDPADGAVWQLVTPPRPARDHPLVPKPLPHDDCGVPKLSLMDLWIAALPILCRATLAHSWDRISTAGIPSPVGVHHVMHTLPSSLHLPGRTEHVCPHADAVLTPRGSLDQIGDSYVYKQLSTRIAHAGATNAQCVQCFPTEVHSINPEVWDHSKAVAGYRAAEWWAMAAYRLAELVEHMGQPRRITITSWTLALGRPLEWIPTLRCPLVVLVEDPADAHAVEAHAWPLGQTAYALVVPRSVNGRSLATLRVILASTVVCTTMVNIVDTHLKTAAVLDWSLGQPTTYMSTLTHLAAPCADMGALKPGRGTMMVDNPFSRLLPFIHIWGMDEALLDRGVTSCVQMSAANASPDLEWGFPVHLVRRCPLAFASTVRRGDEVKRATRGTRLVFILVLREVLALSMAIPGRIGLLEALSLPLEARRDPMDVQLLSTAPLGSVAEEAPVTINAAVRRRVGRVTWFVMGSRGDVVPCLALARHMYSLGVDVCVVRPHTEEEGNMMLAAVEKGMVLTGAPVFARTWMEVTTTQGVKFGPPELPNLTASVSLRPPMDVVRPTDFKAGMFFNWLLNNILRDEYNLWNIGSYPGRMWLPRSMDGLTFLRRTSVPLEGRPIQVAIDMGSSSVPPPVFEGAVAMPKPYTFEDMLKVKVVLGHAGAGSVQSWAAANVTYVALDNSLDRDYYDPLNCGAGCQFDGNPDHVISMLGETDLTVWVLAWRLGWSNFWHLVSCTFLRHFFTFAWLALAIAIRVFMSPSNLALTVGPIAGVVATLLASHTPRWFAVWASPYVVDIVRFGLTWTGLAWAELVWEVAKFVARVSAAPGFWVTLALTDNLTLTYCLALLTSFGSPVGTLFHAAMSIIGYSDVEDPAYMGISLAFPAIPVPLFHVRFFNAERTRRYEGNWGGPVGGMYQPYTVRVSSYLQDMDHEFVVKTSIPWQHFEGLASMTAPYFVLWNCQSSSVVATWPVWGGMGIASLVLIPSMLWGTVAYFAALLVTGVLVLLLNIVPVLYVLMEAAGLVHYIKPLRSICFTMASRLTNPRLPLYARAMHALVGVTVAWGAPDLGELDSLWTRFRVVANGPGTRAERAELLRDVLRANPVAANDPMIARMYMGFLSVVMDPEL